MQKVFRVSGIFILVGASFLGNTQHAFAQTASQTARTVCNDHANAISRILFDAKSKGVLIGELNRRVMEVSVSGANLAWLNGVSSHMIDSIVKVPSFSERELATLGYSYCIERRPSGL